MIKLILEKAGCRVAEAENGQIGFEMATARDFAVVLMDMQMPVLDGYGRRAAVADYQTPIIALTANAMTGDQEKCYAAGCVGFIAKPVDIDELIATLEGYVGKAEPALPNREQTHQTELHQQALSDPAHVNSKTRPLQAAPASSEQQIEYRMVVQDLLLDLQAAIEKNDFELISDTARRLAEISLEHGHLDVSMDLVQLAVASRTGEPAAINQAMDQFLSTIRPIILFADNLSETEPAVFEQAEVKRNGCCETVPIQAGLKSETSSGNVANPIYSNLPMDQPEFREIAEEFVESLEQKLELFEQLIETSEHAEIAKEAHWLKGAGGTCGFSEFYEPAVGLEFSARAGKADDYSGWMNQIRDILSRIVILEPGGCA